MINEITMPKLSDTMTEGRLVSWKKNSGERVERGEIIAEVETDKANMELEAFVSGTLLETRVRPGELVPVGTLIAIIGDASESASVVKEISATASAEPVQKPLQTDVTGQSEENEIQPEATKVQSETASEKTGGEEKASPLVRRLARDRGIDLSKVTGSGPDGRIVAGDLDAFIQLKKTPAGEPKTGKLVKLPDESSTGESRPLSRMRTAIARTVTASWQEIPHFTVTIAIDMKEVEEVRRELKVSDTSVTVNDLIVKACAMALQKYPLVNNGFAGDRIKVNNEINIGLVVSLEEGLLIPVLKGCQGLSMREISGRSRDLIEQAMSGKISEKELSGGTFTISNMGMFGVLEFKALIYPPQGAILAVGAVCDQAVVWNGEIVPGRIMRVTLSADHRVMDGAYAARFLQELKRVLENPVAMLV